jgi:hypothetical protein
MTHALTRTHAIAPKALIEEIDRLVGPRRRSEFITDAAAEKLKREKLLRLTREVAKLPRAKGPAAWDTPEGASEWVHDLRRENDYLRNV